MTTTPNTGMTGRQFPRCAPLLAEQVCYTGSVSKLLAPALRVGWMLAPQVRAAPS